MPPRKKKRLLKSTSASDTGSGGPSDSDSRKEPEPVASKTSKAQPDPSADATEVERGGTSCTSTAATAGTLQPEKQISGFVSQQELAKHARSLGLKRTMLADLKQQSDLDSAYVGGQVMAHCSLPYSQGHDLTIFIQDESTSQGSQPKHLRVTFDSKLSERMPVLRDDAKLFLHRALVKEETPEFSQDHGKCLLVRGAEAQVWIVHRDVRKSYFFSEKSCGKQWWIRTKQRRQKIQSMW